MKTILVLFAILILLILGITVFKFAPANGRPFLGLPGFHKSVAVVNNHTVSLMVANSDKEKQVGLSGKDSLPEDMGMAFPFNQPGYYAFWMHAMRFPLDIIYLRNQHVVSIFSNVPNPSFPTDSVPIYKPEEPADTVLEVNAGTANKYNLKKGDEVKITL